MPYRLNLLLVPVLWATIIACDASYTSDRSRSDAGSANLALADAEPTSDTHAPLDDGASSSDGAAAVDGGVPAGGTFAAGNWEGRTGHFGTGSAQLFRRADGVIELRFSADFATNDGLPGGVVVLSRRESIGSRIDGSAGDLDLGELKVATGTQAYVVPGGDDGRRYAWVFCEPFGLEIARAAMEDVQ